MSTCHHLKIHPEPFLAVREGRKTAEFRDCRDRDFQVGDAPILREYDPEIVPAFDSDVPGAMKQRGYTGEEERVIVTDITTGYGIPKGYAMLSFHRTTSCPQPTESE